MQTCSFCLYSITNTFFLSACITLFCLFQERRQHAGLVLSGTRPWNALLVSHRKTMRGGCEGSEGNVSCNWAPWLYITETEERTLSSGIFWAWRFFHVSTTGHRMTGWGSSFTSSGVVLSSLDRHCLNSRAGPWKRGVSSDMLSEPTVTWKVPVLVFL